MLRVCAFVLQSMNDSLQNTISGGLSFLCRKPKELILATIWGGS